jgi:hypothetical protein
MTNRGGEVVGWGGEVVALWGGEKAVSVPHRRTTSPPHHLTTSHDLIFIRKDANPIILQTI